MLVTESTSIYFAEQFKKLPYAMSRLQANFFFWSSSFNFKAFLCHASSSSMLFMLCSRAWLSFFYFIKNVVLEFRKKEYVAGSYSETFSEATCIKRSNLCGCLLKVWKARFKQRITSPFLIFLVFFWSISWSTNYSE